MRRLLVPLLLLLLSAATPAAAETAIEACARLAAHPSEPDRGGIGVEAQDIDVDAALPACRAAVAASPDTLPETYRLARVLLVAGQLDEYRRLIFDAASRGYAPAQMGYSNALRDGRAMPVDLLGSFTWMQRAADQGNSLAQQLLAEKYLHGIGIAPDIDRAIAYFELSAAAGDSESHHQLGKIYADDRSGRMQPDLAATHLKLAIAGGDENAVVDLGYLYKCDCPLRDLAAALAQFETATASGTAYGFLAMGREYLSGKIIPADKAKALEQFRRGAALGELPSAYELGRFYASGDIVAQDDAEAERWWLYAASGGYARAQLALGTLYLRSGDKTVIGEAVFWLEQAAKSGLPRGYLELAQYYAGPAADDLDRAYAYGLLASREADAEIAGEGRAMMESVRRMREFRAQNPRLGRG